MYIISKISFLFILICSFTKSYGISSDTTFIKKDSILYSGETFKNNLPLLKPDTTLSGFQYYSPSRSIETLDLGNIGLSYFYLIPKFEIRNGFNFGINEFSKYKAKRFYFEARDTIKSFTDLILVLGSKKEQFVDIRHGQKFHKNIAAGISIRRIRSEGFFNKQISDLTSANIYADYISSKGGYKCRIDAELNKVTHEENGGIASDSLLLSNFFLDQKILPVNLLNSKVKRKSKEFGYSDEYKLMAFPADSIQQRMELLLGTQFSFKDFAFSYNDLNPRSGFYTSVFSDTLVTKDTTYYKVFDNRIFLKLKASKNLKDREILAGLGKEDISFARPRIKIEDNLFLFYSAKASDLKVESYYYLSGYNKGDFSFHSSYNRFVIDSLVEMSLTGSYQKRTPDLFLQEYSSNHFIWKNSFAKGENFELTSDFKIQKLRTNIGGKFTSFKNYIYFNNAAKPQKDDKILNIFSVYLEKNFNWKKWNFRNLLVYQKELENRNLISFPTLIYKGSLFYERWVFKKALRTQLGFDLTYFTNYFSYSYMPAITSFFIQNRIETGNYPLVDFFLNMQIKKRAKIFFKIEHLNYGLTGNNFYLIPHYPYAGRSFKLGINWNFLN